MICSQDNSRLKYLRKLFKDSKERRGSRLFTVEGLKLFLEAPDSRIRDVYISECLERDLQAGVLSEALSSKLVSHGFESIREDIFHRLTDTRTPQGVVTVVEMEDGFDEPSAPISSFTVVLEDIQDPGNLGTIIRSSEAAGADTVYVSRGCADIYGPKAVRASAGSIFRMKVIESADLNASVVRIKDAGVTVYAAHLKGSVSYTEPDYSGACAFLIGNEGRGLSESISALADCYVRIDMSGSVESLNAAIAATIMMFEVKRQRKGR